MRTVRATVTTARLGPECASCHGLTPPGLRLSGAGVGGPEKELKCPLRGDWRPLRLWWTKDRREGKRRPSGRWLRRGGRLWQGPGTGFEGI